MGKHVWMSPSSDKIVMMLHIQVLLENYRRENRGWAKRVIANYYKGKNH